MKTVLFKNAREIRVKEEVATELIAAIIRGSKGFKSKDGSLFIRDLSLIEVIC